MTTLSFGDAAVHVVLVGLAALVLTISMSAYLRRQTYRYLFLSLAFGLLAAGQVVELLETLFFSEQLIEIPLTGIHLSHFLDFLMLSSFSAALIIKPGENLGTRR